MRILVLGGTRFVGPHVVRELLDAGQQVVVFHRGETESERVAGAEHVHGDFRDFERHLPVLLAFEPDVVVDLCAFRRDDGRRVRAFKGVARRGVVASSADVYRAFGRVHRTEPGGSRLALGPRVRGRRRPRACACDGRRGRIRAGVQRR
jgi:NAD(P)-dependent dehydrogenase (short-subunit alcohol dehydrogenase family)